MSTEKWEVRKRLPGQASPAQWWVIAPDQETGKAFPWAGRPRKEPGMSGRWAFPFGSQKYATSALREFLDREADRREHPHGAGL